MQRHVSRVRVKDHNSLGFSVPIGCVFYDELKVENGRRQISLERQGSDTEGRLHLVELYRNVDVKRFLCTRHDEVPFKNQSSFCATSQTFVNEPDEKCRVDDIAAPLGVILGSGLGRDDFIERLALLLEMRHIRPGGNQHVAKLYELRAVADRTMTWDDDRLVSHEFERSIR